MTAKATREVDAAQVYTLLQTSPKLGVEEIARRLDGDPASVHACMRLLHRLSLLRQEEPGVFTVVRPETGMTILLSRAEAQAAGSEPGAAERRERADGHSLSGSPLSPREWQVLQLLAQGCTDEAVARNLGVSLRTVRRITADLMERLDARSRFQAGLKAARIFAARNMHSRHTHSRPAVRSHPLPAALR
ncbi:helix-turn-helix domain-containing protein [Nonomuraea jiangxiensis]|uniref:Regulatory protein, luxR family n=1 Tax=Nonomuraea jiangxiensis TaxID=633440 RepID=A0A1G9CQF3_9ACTN|nr:helix-turn-helix transcriptional regulator [Nonomuraea jiangxiensis]SDK53829.1 regulatory protein, luxR family [Nonomuraea jiangxiensis]